MGCTVMVCISQTLGLANLEEVGSSRGCRVESPGTGPCFTVLRPRQVSPGAAAMGCLGQPQLSRQQLCSTVREVAAW